MVIFTKKLGQLKQWTGEKLGSTRKTEKPTEIKTLQSETKSRFDGIRSIRDSLNSFMKSLDESRNSSLGELSRSISAQSNFHGENEFGTLLITFGDGVSKLSDHQNKFADEIRIGLLMNLDAILNETKEFERLRKKLKNRRLDYDANNNKLQRSKKEDPALEESVKTTKMKYEETLQKLEEMMVTISKQETELIDPFIGFMENQINFYHNCLKTSGSILQILKEGKTDLKSIDFVAASFRRELEEEEFWLNSQNDSEEEGISAESGSNVNNMKAKNQAINAAPVPKFDQICSDGLMMVKANYNFTAESENEMSLNKGDIIKVTKHIDEGWWVGVCNGKSGMFPSNYVSVIEYKNRNSEKMEALDLKLKSTSESSNPYDESKSSQLALKPGFSYLPQGSQITFIGRKAIDSKSHEEAKIEIATFCGQCDCEEFAANFFKPGHCNNCFHKH